MSTPIVQQLRHPREKIYGALVLILGALIWLVVLGFLAWIISRGQTVQILVPVVEVVIIVLALMITKIFYRAYLFGHAVLVQSDQFPYLYAKVSAGAQKLGLSKAPETFVYNSHGLTNAFAMRVFQNRMVLLTSAILDVGSNAQVNFIIGHELGHHAAGHLSFWKNMLKYPGYVVPFLGPAYHRARELTADRIGAYLAADLEASRTALQMLACGSARLNASMNAAAFGNQEARVPPVTGFLLNVFSGYPRLTRRVREVESLYRSLPSSADAMSRAPDAAVRRA